MSALSGVHLSNYTTSCFNIVGPAKHLTSKLVSPELEFYNIWTPGTISEAH